MSRRPPHDEESDSSRFKRLKSWDSTTSSASLSYNDYTIAWICALPLELEASRVMLDKEHPSLHSTPGDDNMYILGHIGQHNVVMACLPGQYGTNNAAIVATNLKRSFLRIRATLMVGIGGGAPAEANDLRLGDVVVGTRVVQYDMGKNVGDGKFQMTAVPTIPSRLLLAAVSTLRSKLTQYASSARVTTLLQTGLSSHLRPSHPDQLFQASYEHPSDKLTCDECDPSKLEKRGVRAFNEPRIHYGVIASASTVMKNARARDDLAREHSVLCFEMEAAGIMDSQCLPIRGICDYSDSHKNKAWQKYAAAAAAAYARELLEALPPALGEPSQVQRLGTGIAGDRFTVVDRSSLNRRERLLESLDFFHNGRMTNIQRAHSQTCRWFLKHPKYLGWLNHRKQSETHGFLWIVGKAGAGKSTIMKFAYLETKKQLKDTGATVASFFFNARGDILERSITGMYRSLLLQLLRTYPDLQAILDNPDIVPPNQTTCPGLNALKEALEYAVMALADRSFTCFVDALDECDEQEVRDMVQFFTELAEKISQEGIQFRVCFSSRPYPYIDIRQDVLLILEKEDGHAEDLSRYVESRLMITSPPLKNRILEKAAGIFMWVVLVVNILNKERNDGALALRQRLEHLPAKLSDLFRSILTRDSHQVDRLLLCVLWVLCAKRPLNPLEFRHALWAGLLETGLGDPELPGTAPDDAAKLVTSSSKGLAEITTSMEPTVQFIHESVRDYLVKDGGLKELWPDLGLNWEAHAHQRLRHCCSAYLAFPDFQSLAERLEVGEERDEVHTLSEQYPFLEYASQQVLHHSNAAAAVIPQDYFIFQFFNTYGIHMVNLFERFKIRRYSRTATPLYVLADMGLSNLVRTQVQKEPATRVNEKHEHPFFAALAGGHNLTAAALMGLSSTVHNGIDFTDDLDFRNHLSQKSYLGRTPLSWAAQEGKLSLVKILVEAGEDINEEDGSSRTPFQRAMSNQHLEVAWFLVDNGTRYENRAWFPNERDLLVFAAKKNDVAKARFLVDRGAEVNAEDVDGNTALHFASEVGSEIMARLLYEAGANVHVQNRFKETALHLASRSYSPAVARLLIDKGAEINVLSHEGKTALMYAAAAGSEGVTWLLLDRGADKDASSNAGHTALVYATIAGKEAVARLLLDRGADANVSSQKGTTALIFASMAGNEAMAQLLIEGGADVEAPGLGGQTALVWASRAGNEGLVNLLIDKGGANVDALADDGRTALTLASERGKLSTAQLLIDKSGAKAD